MSKTYRARADVRVFTELILSLIAIMVFGTFAIKPTLATIGELRSEISEKEKVVQALDLKITNLTQAKAYYDANQATINLLDSAVPDSSLPASEIRQIEGLAQRSGVEITNFDIEKAPLFEESKGEKEGEEKVLGAKNMEFLMSAAGEYPSLISFLTNLELMRRPLVGRSTTISIVDDARVEGLNMIIEAVTPYFIK
ncbi:MAG: hypothetical protein UV74_C0013G0558 [Candidatus Woesebacteria bacterium GW2011_GWB1_43_14]|uniref:Uncharacterized protein n=1 Tax=Candidatus Woesebacteria bacterium GW2011_GWB1_43_14 TaxID=1618578 RepID=A0A0G1FQX3_9BACT|nr:MAG: hypothetical protein UT21_C0001G0271 [Candidatus Woesebacteria bacterium GW2011_GWA1_39_11b]KKS77985.1 MAG: hypothetical protein UV51_C0003G0020 [Candidatus Woesebacteria bacterium GW2011_GWC1_42_9]KKS97436.1 MAG: hypothetical protein UV74_C0013G0558 [Candidatus Woesebacteria bacterium GW2011_GWB1_43_14]